MERGRFFKEANGLSDLSKGMRVPNEKHQLPDVSKIESVNKNLQQIIIKILDVNH